MATKAVLLANLGSPDSYQVKDLKKYLSEREIVEMNLIIGYNLMVSLFTKSFDIL